MYGPNIMLLCARPADDVLGAGAAILRARSQGCIVQSLMMTNGLVAPPRWQLWRRFFGQERQLRQADDLMQTCRRIAADYGHQFMSWHSAHDAGQIVPNLTQLAREVERTCANLKPDVIWAPAFLGLDPDYDALNVIASRLATFAAQHLKRRIEVYEYIPRTLVRVQLGFTKKTRGGPRGGHGGGHAASAQLADSQNTPMAFPNRYGMELVLNLTMNEAAKQIRALDALRMVYDEPLPSSHAREVFRLLPTHDYARPPYGYKNPFMIRGQAVGRATADRTIPALLRLQHAPLQHLPLG